MYIIGRVNSYEVRRAAYVGSLEHRARALSRDGNILVGGVESKQVHEISYRR